jgi:integron integrase
MNNLITDMSAKHTLAVIDGGLNAKPTVQTGRPVHQPKLLDQVRQAIRIRHYSYRTEKAYIHWIKRFIFFHSKRHPGEMGEAEIGQFLSALATDLRLSASTQNQALNALLFLYREVLNKQIGFVGGVVRAKRPHRLPVVLTRQEIRSIFERLEGVDWIMAMLLYGGGLRLMECVRLRVKDIDLSRNQILVRAGKGDKDRHTMLPAAVKESLIEHLERMKRLHDLYLQRGLGRVSLPNALERKYPNASKEWAGSGCFQPALISWIE